MARRGKDPVAQHAMHEARYAVDQCPDLLHDIGDSSAVITDDSYSAFC